jgi:hypothetical protein
MKRVLEGHVLGNKGIYGSVIKEVCDENGFVSSKKCVCFSVLI